MYEMMDVLLNLIMGILSQYMHVSNHQSDTLNILILSIISFQKRLIYLFGSKRAWRGGAEARTWAPSRALKSWPGPLRQRQTPNQCLHSGAPNFVNYILIKPGKKMLSKLRNSKVVAMFQKPFPIIPCYILSQNSKYSGRGVKMAEK